MRYLFDLARLVLVFAVVGAAGLALGHACRPGYDLARQDIEDELWFDAMTGGLRPVDQWPLYNDPDWGRDSRATGRE
jgi:hypothetical protein